MGIRVKRKSWHNSILCPSQTRMTDGWICIKFKYVWDYQHMSFSQCPLLKRYCKNWRGYKSTLCWKSHVLWMCQVFSYRESWPGGGLAVVSLSACCGKVKWTKTKCRMEFNNFIHFLLKNNCHIINYKFSLNATPICMTSSNWRDCW